MPIIISFKEGSLEFLVPEDIGTGFKVLKKLSVDEEVDLKSFSYKVTRFERHTFEVEVRDLPNGDTIRRLTISPLNRIDASELFNKMNSEDARWKDLFDQIPMSLEITKKIPPKK